MAGSTLQALDPPLQPADHLVGAPAQRAGVVEQPEAVAGGDEQQDDEDAGDDRRRVAALAAEDEHREAGGEQREEHDVGERVLEDHRDEHEGVGHAALLQHAVGDGRAAHAAGGEEVGGGEPGEVDAQRQAEAHRVAQQVEQAAEEQRVEEQRDALDGDGDHEPRRRGVLEQLDRVRLAGEPRHDEEQRHDDDQEDDRRAPRVAAARCLRVAQRFFLPPRRWRAAGDRSSPRTARSISWRRIHA